MEAPKRLKRNAIRCKHCDEVIESKSVHDFRKCGCGKVFVDGGLDYQRCGWPGGEIEDSIDFSPTEYESYRLLTPGVL
jgi:hypothetical protein